MTPARNAEADQASRIFHASLAVLGVKVAGQAQALWASLPIDASPSVTAAWLRRAVNLTMAARAVALNLAIAYYRLVRALRTGATIADPRGRGGRSYVTLAELRAEFYELAGLRASQVGAGRPGGDERIPVERSDDLERVWPRLERDARQEAAVDIDRKGPRNLEQKLRDIDTDAPAREVDEKRGEARRQAGARQAAAVARIAQNGARQTIDTIGRHDRRVIGYVRLSRTGTPCGWCAMLISRGPVYRSAVSAETYAEGQKYHDNCNCYAEPVYSREQYNSSPLFELNRRYAKEWPQVTRGLSGKAALSAWRRYIRQQQAAAQAARQTTNVQEA